MQDEEDYDILMKIIIVGDSGVGKTNLVNRFAQQKFLDDSKPTVGVEFFFRHIDIMGKTIKAQVWDTAGQEKFRAITYGYYRGALGAMICYDITKEQSFLNVERWIEELREHGDSNLVMMLIGTKSDLESKRVVRNEDGTQKALQHNMAFLETSALKAANVGKAFSMLLEKIYVGIDNQGKEYQKRASIKLTSEPITIKNAQNTKPDTTKSKKQCC
ncbi:unnamed protein product (macronuclear) [Paramecium tetraurelia]|uniref:Uncharacterized protein n=1 Tax=Paramecium tetraurelia TaxID=5888 RepID=A0DPW9_PARTE|nr:uncharacterized protein GSPATT00002485001 [Paramecium tetraurelia]CAK85086.1 unnamed protein product [Paramecium tetraurelia]|eukprot:XP_001452483.1 hypothetical protein (macronuclear) [Paramecium tetraurelia strain d4-2]